MFIHSLRDFATATGARTFPLNENICKSNKNSHLTFPLFALCSSVLFQFPNGILGPAQTGSVRYITKHLSSRCWVCGPSYTISTTCIPLFFFLLTCKEKQRIKKDFHMKIKNNVKEQEKEARSEGED